MRTLVVFDSMFGNTRQVAEAITAGLAGYTPVDLVPVEETPTRLPDDVDLLVVGGPTHVHGLSSTRSRQVTPQLAEQGATPARTGLREWLTGLSGPRPAAATFDTRFAKARWLTGSAATGAARLLRRRGHRLVLPAESFFVDKTPGPLAAGELDRARAWGERLGSAVVAAGGKVG
jgi:hypothetical protein